MIDNFDLRKARAAGVRFDFLCSAGIPGLCPRAEVFLGVAGSRTRQTEATSQKYREGEIPISERLVSNGTGELVQGAPDFVAAKKNGVLCPQLRWE